MMQSPEPRRLLKYWQVSGALYVSGLVLLWIEVWLDAASATLALWLSAGIAGNVAAFYGCIRTSAHFRLSASRLAAWQGIAAIILITIAYCIATPVRGAILSLLSVVLLLCAFALSPAQSLKMSAFAMISVGCAMVFMHEVDPTNYAGSVEIIHFCVMSSMLIGIAFLTGQFNRLRAHLIARNDQLKAQQHELQQALSRIEWIASRDELTQLANRRLMMQLLSDEEKRHASQALTLSVALLDIDHFKVINDTYGHEIGDEALRCFARLASSSLRSKDTIARWGGEEFLVMLPDTDGATALTILDRMKEKLSIGPLEIGNVVFPMTFSAGIAIMRPTDLIADTIRSADQAMFKAKAEGRNSIHLNEHPSA